MVLDLKKNDVAVLDLKKKAITKFNIGLGWDTNADLDVHAILRDQRGKEIETVYYGRLKGTGVQLSGDNLTGEGDGDDEVIFIDIEKLSPNVQTISVYVNIYSGVQNFGKIKGGFIRIFNETEELAKAKLNIEEVKNDKTVHFADLEVQGDFKFSVIMEGGAFGTLKKNYKRAVTEEAVTKETSSVSEDTTPKKKKKFFGLF